jgi:hypothetical protein
MGLTVAVCSGRNFCRVPSNTPPSDKPRAFGAALYQRRFMLRLLDELHRRHGIGRIVHGDQLGAPQYAAKWAADNGVATTAIKLSKEIKRRKARAEQNAAIIAENPDIAIAFPGGRGTNNFVAQVRRAGIKLIDQRCFNLRREPRTKAQLGQGN